MTTMTDTDRWHVDHNDNFRGRDEATAADMLVALKAIIEAMDGPHTPNASTWRRLLDAGKAAIAKAEGRSQ